MTGHRCGPARKRDRSHMGGWEWAKVRSLQMTDDEDLMPQSAAWCERLARQQGGYFYDWRSVLEPGNGEDLYTKLVELELDPSIDVVDAGCGHGQDVLRIAPRVRSVVGYDRTAAFIAIAEEQRRSGGIDNARFLCADSKPSGI